MKAFRRILMIIGIILLVIALAGYIFTCYLASESGMSNGQVRSLASVGNAATNFGIPMDSESRVVVWLIVSQGDALLFGIIAMLAGLILRAVEKTGIYMETRQTETRRAPSYKPSRAPSEAESKAALEKAEAKRQRAEERARALKNGMNVTAARVQSGVDKAAVVAKKGAKRGAYLLSKKLSQFAGEAEADAEQIPESNPVKDIPIERTTPIAEPLDDYEMTISVDRLLGATVDIQVDDGEQALLHTVHINSDPFVIGRGDASDIVLNNLSVSRKHCILSCWQGQLLVQNQSAVNPAKLNGQDIVDEEELYAGDKLLLGLIELEIVSISYDKAMGMSAGS